MDSVLSISIVAGVSAGTSDAAAVTELKHFKYSLQQKAMSKFCCRCSSRKIHKCDRNFVHELMPTKWPNTKLIDRLHSAHNRSGFDHSNKIDQQLD